MSGGAYHIPDNIVQAWEVPMLARVARCMTPAAREQALQEYVAERARRRRHAAVRDKRDRERRTLVGAHVPRAAAEQIAKAASNADMSMTAYIKLALVQALEQGLSNCNKK